MPQVSMPDSTTMPLAGRRRIGAGLLAIVAGSGITAGFAASVADLAPTDPDAALLALRAELTAAVAGTDYDENAPDWDDDRITRSAERLVSACEAIVHAPPAQTAAGLALQAAAAMHRLRDAFGYGHWPSDGEDLAWTVLSRIAGDAYVPQVLPASLRENCEPPRAAA